jgi:hypothetical protein
MGLLVINHYSDTGVVADGTATLQASAGTVEGVKHPLSVPWPPAVTHGIEVIVAVDATTVQLKLLTLKAQVQEVRMVLQ